MTPGMRITWIAPKPSVDGICIQDGCHNVLRGRRRYFCSPACDATWHITRDWQALRRFVFERDHYTCVLCGFTRGTLDYGLEADHIVPIADGGANLDPMNIRTLCEACHKAVTKEWHKERAARKWLDSFLDAQARYVEPWPMKVV